MPTTPPVRLVLLHRGDPPRPSPDPWAADAGARTLALARGIASSDAWRMRPPAVLVARTGPAPAVAAIGRFAEADMRWLQAAGAQAASTMHRLRWLDWEAVEAAVETVAVALEARFGPRNLREFRYAALPRGGLIVLGMLAYLLDLPRERLEVYDAAAEDVPLVLVDDIAVSGLRLSEAASRRPERQLVIATLHAHPDLRSAFVATHPRVQCFVSAYDLRDHAPTELGDAYAAWRERWRARAAPDTLWIGQAEQVVYPWNEPDVGVWNEATGQEEPGWTLVPPDRCLKRRRTPGIAVQTMPQAGGRWRPHPEVMAGSLGDQVVIGHLGTGATFELEGVAADLWRALVDLGDPTAAARRLAGSYDVDPDELTADAVAFVTDLAATGLLIESGA